MTMWLQDRPLELAEFLERCARTDLRVVGNADTASALMCAASGMIRRQILAEPENDWFYGKGLPLRPLHHSWGDRFRDALSCMAGTARVLRRRESTEA